MTDLHDGEHYQAEIDTLHAILQDTRLKGNSPSVLSPAKSVPIDRHKNISGLDKSQESFRENISKVKSPGSVSQKKLSNDKLTNATVLGKSQDGGIDKSDFKVKYPSKEKYAQADSPLLRPFSNLATVKCGPSEKPNYNTGFGESQDDFQAKFLKVSSPSSLTASEHASSDQVANASESSKARHKIKAMYPKLDSSVDDYEGDYSSPFDALHDQAKANNAKAKSSPKVSNVVEAQRLQSDDWFKDLFPTNDQTDTSNPSSKGTWKCFLCGHLAPLKQPNQDLPLVDIAPPGATRQCRLCGQWRR
jgi:hypothetical protein